MSWDPRALPRQEGRVAVVTGGSSGIGYFVVEQLASAGARVVVAARSPERAERALASIRERVPGADVAAVELDLSALASVRVSADRLLAAGGLDLLIANAGVVAAPGSPVGPRRRTADGHELVVGTNLLGHFALAALLWPGLREGGRVVSLGSDSTRMVRFDPADLWSERRYAPFRAYAFSKHAVQLFALELHRRIRAAGDSRASLLAHPGYANGALSEPRPGIDEPAARLERAVAALGRGIAQGKDRGAWPVVRAALDPRAVSGQYYGPSGLLAGSPVLVRPVRTSERPELGAALWSDAERRSGIRFEV